MNLNEIQDLIKLVSKSGLTEVEIEKKDFKITLKAEKAKGNDQPIYLQAPLASAPVNVPAVAPVTDPASKTPGADYPSVGSAIGLAAGQGAPSPAILASTAVMSSTGTLSPSQSRA